MSGRKQLGNFLDHIALMSDMDSRDDQDQVKLMTIHASKGLEFPVVFVGGLEENHFPSSQSAGDPDELEEERRLMYVAVTRAEDQIFLTHAQSRTLRGQTKYNKQSRFVEEIPKELKKEYDLSTSGAISTKSSKSSKSGLQVGDRINNKIFGLGTVKEIWGNICMVMFDDRKYGMRRMDSRMIDKI